LVRAEIEFNERVENDERERKEKKCFGKTIHLENNNNSYNL